jgi:hypothetical protein
VRYGVKNIRNSIQYFLHLVLFYLCAFFGSCICLACIVYVYLLYFMCIVLDFFVVLYVYCTRCICCTLCVLYKMYLLYFMCIVLDVFVVLLCVFVLPYVYLLYCVYCCSYFRCRTAA